MGTEVGVSFSALRAQLESERNTLDKIDENIKKIVQNPRFSDSERREFRFNKPPGEFGRGTARPGQRNFYPDNGNQGNQNRSNDLFGKRKPETKTVFSRLTTRPDSDGEEGPNSKKSRVHSAVSRELPSRAAVLKAQGGDEQAKTRNKRIFGALLGTLQKFKQEEIGLQNKEEKKAQVERKIEEQARQQKEKEQKERKSLFAERETKKAFIKSLEVKMGRVQEFEKWQVSQRHLGNFIITDTKPRIYWLPRKMSDNAQRKLEDSRRHHESYMSSKKTELQDELAWIEARCMRRGRESASEHSRKRTDSHNMTAPGDVSMESEDGGNKRDKFATGGDKAPDSEPEGDDVHENDTNKEKLETDIVTQNEPNIHTVETPDYEDMLNQNQATLDTNQATLDTNPAVLDTNPAVLDTNQATSDVAQLNVDICETNQANSEPIQVIINSNQAGLETKENSHENNATQDNLAQEE